ncbi:hypothetical protein [Coleofasciculus sp. G2-EDA-02]
MSIDLTIRGIAIAPSFILNPSPTKLSELSLIYSACKKILIKPLWDIDRM